MLPTGMDSLGVHRLVRAICMDLNMHGLSLQTAEVPEPLSIYKY